MMNAQEKLKEVLAYLQISPSKLAEMLGYERPQLIYDIQKGRTKRISEMFALKLTSVFPQISKEWLLTGEGEMLRDSVSIGNNSTAIANSPNSKVNTAGGALELALREISEMRKLLGESIRNNKEQADRQREQADRQREQIDRLIGLLERKLAEKP